MCGSSLWHVCMLNVPPNLTTLISLLHQHTRSWTLKTTPPPHALQPPTATTSLPPAVRPCGGSCVAGLLYRPPYLKYTYIPETPALLEGMQSPIPHCTHAHREHSWRFTAPLCQCSTVYHAHTIPVQLYVSALPDTLRCIPP